MSPNKGRRGRQTFAWRGPKRRRQTSARLYRFALSIKPAGCEIDSRIESSPPAGKKLTFPAELL